MKKIDPVFERYKRFLDKQIAEIEPLYNDLNMDIDQIFKMMTARLEVYFSGSDHLSDDNYDHRDTCELREMLCNDTIVTDPCNIVAMLFFDAALQLGNTLFENSPLPRGELISAILAIEPYPAPGVRQLLPRKKQAVSVDGLGRPSGPKTEEPSA